MVLLDGVAGLVWAQGGTPKVVFDFTVVAGQVTRIDMISDEDVLCELDIEYVRRNTAP
jgi:RNA polymerase sigma-70 factor (ECF subfamily)